MRPDYIDFQILSENTQNSSQPTFDLEKREEQKKTRLVVTKQQNASQDGRKMNQKFN